MSRIIDKILLFALCVIAMLFLVHGNTLVVYAYFAIICSAFNYYLIGRDRSDYYMKPEGYKEWLAFSIELISVFVILIFPQAIIILPLVMYDITRSRNYIAFILSIIAIVISFMNSDEMILPIYVVLISFAAIWLCIKSEIHALQTSAYKELRDNSEEKSIKLRSQNSELMNARDTEVYNAQLSERNRIAREIHDNVGHTLSRAILQMGALLAIHKEEPIHSELEGVRETLDTAMNNIRSSVHDLHDDSIDVAASIKSLAEPLEPKFNVQMEIDIGNDMPRQVKYAMIGITKECISNIMKHSKNANVDIKLNEHPSMYQLIVHDYGAPEDEHSNSGGKSKESSSKGSGHSSEVKIDMKNAGMGLESITTRAESVNGTLNISTENGFRVFVTVPR